MAPGGHPTRAAAARLARAAGISAILALLLLRRGVATRRRRAPIPSPRTGAGSTIRSCSSGPRPPRTSWSRRRAAAAASSSSATTTSTVSRRSPSCGRRCARVGADAVAFIPHRLRDGYGLKPETVRRVLAEHAPAAIVTVDCGITAVEGVAVRPRGRRGRHRHRPPPGPRGAARGRHRRQPAAARLPLSVQGAGGLRHRHEDRRSRRPTGRRLAVARVASARRLPRHDRGPRAARPGRTAPSRRAAWRRWRLAARPGLRGAARRGRAAAGSGADVRGRRVPDRAAPERRGAAGHGRARALALRGARPGRARRDWRASSPRATPSGRRSSGASSPRRARAIEQPSGGPRPRRDRRGRRRLAPGRPRNRRLAAGAGIPPARSALRHRGETGERLGPEHPGRLAARHPERARGATSSSSAATSQAVGATPGAPTGFDAFRQSARALFSERVRGRGSRPRVRGRSASCPSRRRPPALATELARLEPHGPATRDRVFLARGRPRRRRLRSRRRSGPARPPASPARGRAVHRLAARRRGSAAWRRRAARSTCTTGSRTTGGATACRSRSCRARLRGSGRREGPPPRASSSWPAARSSSIVLVLLVPPGTAPEPSGAPAPALDALAPSDAARTGDDAARRLRLHRVGRRQAADAHQGGPDRRATGPARACRPTSTPARR